MTTLKKNTASSPSPIEAVEIENNLSLIPRIKTLLTIYRADLSVSPIDVWQIKRSILDYLKTSFPTIPIPDEDLHLHKYKDIPKRKRQDPVASGLLYIRDFTFLTANKFNKQQQDSTDLELKLLGWRDSFVKKLDEIELSLRGVKFKLNACLPQSDDFLGFEKSWEEFYAFNSRGYKQKPDTIILKGLPSRWFAEPRVSSKPSMLVTHTIFSVFGNIRDLNVASDDGLGENAQEGGGDMIPGLQCKIVVQFEKHDDFYNALKLLCGRSMQKHGSRLKADYEATWDRNDFFGNTYQRTTKNHLSTTTRQHQDKTPRLEAHIGRFDSDGVSSKRFKE